MGPGGQPHLRGPAHQHGVQLQRRREGHATRRAGGGAGRIRIPAGQRSIHTKAITHQKQIPFSDPTAWRGGDRGGGVCNVQAFLELHPEYSDRPFYVTGESYGGHYVPAVTSKINNANKAKEGPVINIKVR